MKRSWESGDPCTAYAVRKNWAVGHCVLNERAFTGLGLDEDRWEGRLGLLGEKGKGGWKDS